MSVQHSMQPSVTSAEASQYYALWVRRSGYLTLFVALLIVVLKLTAAIMTNAASALASFMDAMLDLLVSLLNFFALRYALKPADDDHRFGHGKAEALMALFQAAFLTAAAVLLSYQGISRFYSPEPVGAVHSGIWLTLICTALTIGLVLAQRLIIRRTGSIAVQADLAHYQSDILLNASVLLALVLVANSLLWADAAMSLLIAGYLMWNAQQLARESFTHLLDAELAEELRQQIVDQLLRLPQVRGVDQLRSRQAGPKVFIQLRLVLSDQLSLLEAHAIADAAEQQVALLFRDAEVIIHVDPASAVVEPEYPARTPMVAVDAR